MFFNEDHNEASKRYMECWAAEEQPEPAEKKVAGLVPPAPGSPPRSPWIAGQVRRGFSRERNFVHAIKVGDLLAPHADPQDAPMPTQPVALEEYKEKPNKFQEKAKA